MGVMRRLARRRGVDELRVGLIGAGFVGKNLAYQFKITPGMRCAIILNRTPANAVDAYRRAGWTLDQIVVSDDLGVLAGAIRSGRPAVTGSLEAFRSLDEVEIVMEATGSHEYGAVAMRAALEAGKDVVTLNAEADVTVGYLLKTIADRNDVVYTVGNGDQPGVLARLIEFVEGAGFEIVAAVNCKGFLDIHATPESIKEWSVKQGISLPMTTSFTDGTKINIENAVVANAFGLLPQKRGMNAVRTHLDAVTDDIVAILDGHGAVEYTLGGDFRGGVLVIGYHDDNNGVKEALQYLKMGEGPYYTFYRPYHLVHVEVATSIAEVYLDREPTIVTAGPHVTDVVTLAKRDLEVGDILDGIGGWTIYGEIDRMENLEGLLPIGIAEGARVLRPIKQDQPVPLDAIELADSPIVRMRAEQDALIAALSASR